MKGLNKSVHTHMRNCARACESVCATASQKMSDLGKDGLTDAMDTLVESAFFVIFVIKGGVFLVAYGCL